MQAHHLSKIVARGETSRAEFKREIDLTTKNGRAKLGRTIIGIANACRPTGFLVLGADENGTPSRSNFTALTEEQIQKIVAEYCEPYVDVALHHIDFDPAPVTIIEVLRRRSDLPYRAAKTAGDGPIVERGFVYFRYGRHIEKARFAEINALIKEAESSASAPSRADDYAYLSLSQKEAAMQRDWKTALRKAGARVSSRSYYLGPPTEQRLLADKIVPATLNIKATKYLFLTHPVPSPIKAGALDNIAYRLAIPTTNRPSHLPRLRVILAHGTIGKPLVPTRWGDTVLERERFGWYVGPGHRRQLFDAHLFFENVRNRATMQQALQELIEWIPAHAAQVTFLSDERDPFAAVVGHSLPA